MITLSESDFNKYIPSNSGLNVELAAKIKDPVFNQKMKGYLYNHKNESLTEESENLYKKLWVFYIYEKLLIDLSFQLKNKGTNRATSTTTSPSSIEEIKMKISENKQVTFGMANQLLTQLKEEISNYSYETIQGNYFSGWFPYEK